VNWKITIGIIIFIICCILAFLIPKVWVNNNCEGGVCPPPTERRNAMLDWLMELDWYWVVAIVGAIVAGLWFFFSS